MNRPRMIVDTDPGHDDMVALILAHRFAEVVGITTVCGNAALEHTTRNALRLCELLGVDTPVHSGSAVPLEAPAEFAADVHGVDGLGGIPLPEATRGPASEQAVDYLLDSAAPDLWVVAIGPLTNIARVIMRDAEWLSRIAGLSVMGGSSHGGNVTPSAEFNIYFDPEAASTVFQANGNVLMSGLNLTHQVQVSRAEINAAREAGVDSPLARFVDLNFARVITAIEKLTGTDEIAMHDPCAVLAVTHEEMFGFVPRNVSVELSGQHTRGMTVVDERFRATPPKHNVRVGYDVDAANVKDVIFSGIYNPL